MPTTKKNNTVYKKLKLNTINFHIILFISLSFLKFIISQDEIREVNSERGLGGYSPSFEEKDINDKECFNNILRFTQKNYLLNNIGSNKNGDFLIQYNEYMNYEGLNSSRFFYGSTKNGQYFFPNNSSFSNEFNINIDEDIFEDSYFSNIFWIEESKNLFVSIKNDINKKNQYLFNINAYNSLVELYDLNNNNYLI